MSMRDNEGKDIDKDGKVFSVHCPSCGQSFSVRMQGQRPIGRRYTVNYRCPRCGKQFSEERENHDGKDRQAFRMIVGIPLAVLAVLLVLSVIGNGFGMPSLDLLNLDSLRYRMEGWMGSQNMMLLCAKLLVLLVCLPAHECAHAWMADRLGDPTGRNQGRITLNPLKHLDFFGTVMILFVGVGYAKPVPVHIDNFRNKKRDFALTALAGPVSNLLMAVLFLILLRLSTGLQSGGSFTESVARILMYTAYINVSLAVFNLIPIPPLDGSRVLMAFLPDGAYDKALKYERYMMIILLVALLWLGRMGYSPTAFLAGKIFNALYRGIMWTGRQIL